MLIASGSLLFLCAPLFVSENKLSRAIKTSITVGVAILLTLGISLYLWVGSPEMLETKINPELDQKYIEIIAKVEKHLLENPEDAEGWEVIAPTYFSLNQTEKAFDSYAKAIKFGRSTGTNWLGLGKSDLIINEGKFSAMSKVAFGKAVEKSPNNIEALFFYSSLLLRIETEEDVEKLVKNFIRDNDYSEEELLPLLEVLEENNASKVD